MKCSSNLNFLTDSDGVFIVLCYALELEMITRKGRKGRFANRVMTSLLPSEDFVVTCFTAVTRGLACISFFFLCASSLEKGKTLRKQKETK